MILRTCWNRLNGTKNWLELIEVLKMLEMIKMLDKGEALDRSGCGEGFNARMANQVWFFTCLVFHLIGFFLLR